MSVTDACLSCLTIHTCVHTQHTDTDRFSTIVIRPNLTGMDGMATSSPRFLRSAHQGWLSSHVSIQRSCPKLVKLRVVIWYELGNFSLSLGNCRKKRGDTEGIPWWSSGSTLQAMGSIPGWGTKILHATEYSQKKKKRRHINWKLLDITH